MTRNPLSPKQVTSFKGSNSRLNIWEGAVRSGKSFISIIRFIKALKEGPPGLGMIVGVSRDAIQRNILTELCALLGYPVPTPKATQMDILGRTVFLVGANDERAQRRIQGSTLALAYVDEVTLIPHGFFKMLLSRLSVTGAQLFATTNPDSPFHWIKTDFLDKTDLDLARFQFRLEDNPSLSADYINNLKKEFSGLWYKRYIDGDWVLAEGTVYDLFDESIHTIDMPPGLADYYIIGIDYGTTNPTVFTLLAYNSKVFPNMWVEKELVYDSKKAGRQRSDTEHVEALIEFIGHKQIRCIYVDPSAASFKVEMQRQGVQGAMDADNDVLNGIRVVTNLLSNGTLKIGSNCTELIREFQTYRWDSKASEKGGDKVIKEWDHCFVAGTKVLTIDGYRNIEDISAGDKVKTRSGWNRVVDTFEHKAVVGEFVLLGRKVVSTPDHKVLTHQKWTPISELSVSDFLFVEVEDLPWINSNTRATLTNQAGGSKLSDSTRLPTDGIQNLTTLAMQITSGAINPLLNEDMDISIEMFTSPTMGLYHPDTIFITKTTITSTTVLGISSLSQLKNICPGMVSICRKIKEKLDESTWTTSDHLPNSGTPAKKEESGTSNITQSLSVPSKQSPSSVSSVEISQKARFPGPGFVRISVSLPTGESLELMTSIDNAWFVHQSSESTNIVRGEPAAVSAQVYQDAKVYNIHVDKEHEYYVEGILVHNCLDSLRYSIFSHFKDSLGQSVSKQELDNLYNKAAGIQQDLPRFFQDQSHVGNSPQHSFFSAGR